MKTITEEHNGMFYYNLQPYNPFIKTVVIHILQAYATSNPHKNIFHFQNDETGLYPLQ